MAEARGWWETVGGQMWARQQGEGGGSGEVAVSGAEAMGSGSTCSSKSAPKLRPELELQQLPVPTYLPLCTQIQDEGVSPMLNGGKKLILDSSRHGVTL